MSRAAQTQRMTTPIGELELVAQAGALVEIRMEHPPGKGHRAAAGRRSRPAAVAAAEGVEGEVLTTAQRQLEDYFAGESDSFALPMKPKGTTFQLEVWRALCKVGYGETTSYGELAARIGRPRAARAVGQALARNPLPVVVPCHRVVGHLGALTGFGGGIERKRWLLALEGHEVALEGHEVALEGHEVALEGHPGGATGRRSAEHVRPSR